MISERKKENNGDALILMFLLMIVSAFSGVFGLAAFQVLTFFMALLMAIYIGLPG